MSRIIDLFKTIFGFTETQTEIGELNEENIEKIGLPADIVKAFKDSWKTQDDLKRALESDGEVKKGPKILKSSKVSRDVAKKVSRTNPSEVQGIEIDR